MVAQRSIVEREMDRAGSSPTRTSGRRKKMKCVRVKKLVDFSAVYHPILTDCSPFRGSSLATLLATCKFVMCVACPLREKAPHRAHGRRPLQILLKKGQRLRQDITLGSMEPMIFMIMIPGVIAALLIGITGMIVLLSAPFMRLSKAAYHLGIRQWIVKDKVVR